MTEKIILQLKDACFAPDGDPILENINLDIPANANIRVSGPSGSGKSTLLKMMAGLIPLTSGELIFKGENFNKMSAQEYRRQVSYVSQTPQLFGETIRDNLAFPAQIREEAFDENRAKQLLAQVKLDYLNIDQSIEHLSGGERQRVGLIRHFMYEPEMWLLDEISSALDENLRTDLWEWVVAHAADKHQNLIWISHIEEEGLKADYEIILGQHQAEWRVN